MTVPLSTVRLQFHREFTFDHAAKLVDYFATLGISHLYASPITTAQPGSVHGYDTVDYARVNPELGGEAALKRLVETLRAYRMGLIVDIVPNHMGIGGAHNAWWLDILTWGRHSAYARHFDIDWHSPDPALRGKVLAPFLGGSYGDALQAGHIGLALDEANGIFYASYYAHRFPICPVDYATMLKGAEHHELSALAQRFEGLGTQPADQERARAACAELSDYARSGTGKEALLQHVLQAYAGDAPQGREHLHRLLERQHYRLAWWRTATDETNWRRFFDISSLIGVRAERPDVFDASHALILRLYAQGLIDGVRIDHVDGLAEPREYCQRLRQRLEELTPQRPAEAAAPAGAVAADDVRVRNGGQAPGQVGAEANSLVETDAHASAPGATGVGVATAAAAGANAAMAATDVNDGAAYLVVEKILARGEPLREDWMIDGTTGYDFMNDVGALLHDGRGAAPLAAAWTEQTGRSANFADEALRARRKILAENLSAELDRSARTLHRIARDTPATRDFAYASLRRVLGELVVQFPVYRIYAENGVRGELDERFFGAARERARAALSRADHIVLDRVDTWLGGASADETAASSGDAHPGDAPRKSTALPQRRHALSVFSQLTSPVAAKAIEDTACYRYGRLISRNEVGADPGEFAITVDEFHRGNGERAKRFPRAMLTTATHDHKRGEDVRARLAALSEIPHEWVAAWRRWSILNTPHRRVLPGDDAAANWAPGAADEAMLYQTLIGCWPPMLSVDDEAGIRDLAERVAQWQHKALREAKLRTDWLAPDDAYENACRDFLFDILAPHQRDGFLSALSAFVERLARPGAINSLQQTLLRLTSPGVPDLYQGTELWDFSLVDPDNRRPVDYALRRACLLDDALNAPPAELLSQWRDGRIKLATIRRTLVLRQHASALFRRGAYLPLSVEGAHADSAIAFARQHDNAWVVVIATRLATALLSEHDDLPLVEPARWGDTSVVVPDALEARTLFDWLSSGAPTAQGRRLRLRDVLAHAPVALLVEEGVPRVTRGTLPARR
jgi:(1->4)-alpha-D-glucan 1-alpha-D-glucosylmutase